MTTPTRPVIIESCVESLEEATRAAKNGAHRLELCARLDLEGLTPSTELISATQALGLPIKVMIRPRAGDFSYDAEDKALIANHIENVKTEGIRHIVYGSLKDGRLDIDDLKTVYKQADPVSMTIHKAIDQSEAPLKDVLELVKWAHLDKVNLAILSSGQAATAMEGAFRLQRMQQLCKDDIELIVAGKVTPKNLEQLKMIIPAPAFHGRMIV